MTSLDEKTPATVAHIPEDWLDSWPENWLPAKLENWRCDVCKKPINPVPDTKKALHNEGAWISDYSTDRPGLRCFGHRSCMKHLRRRGDFWVCAATIYDTATESRTGSSPTMTAGSNLN
jgi:hypothetical protein